MKTNQRGLNLIKEFEGLRLEAYYCIAGKLTLGYGSTGSHVKRGMIITKEQAEKLLIKDLAVFEKAVSEAVKVKINENQFAALVSFSFNCGAGALRRSTLLKKLNAGDSIGAANEFPKWCKYTDPKTRKRKVAKGLARRRKAERELFLSQEFQADPKKEMVLREIDTLITRFRTDQKRTSENIRLLKELRLKLI